MKKGKEPEFKADRLAKLELLVDELMKESPHETKVKDFMQQTGIEYSDDPIERINLVLQALHFQE